MLFGPSFPTDGSISPAATRRFVTVRNVSVNYAIRFSGPVTGLTARRVWYGVGAPSICQANTSGWL